MDYEISVRNLENLRRVSPGNPPAEFCLLDVREPWEAARAAISDSRLIPMGEIPSRALQELDPQAHIVVYCHHGQRSYSVAIWLREQGFLRAQSLAGGIDAWSQQVDPSIDRY